MPIASILSRYEPVMRWSVSEGESGWNNTTRIAEDACGVKRVLRIYETHRDADKIAFEHEVLLKLGTCGLPFAVPRPVAMPSGATFATLTDGTGRYAALFTYTEGVRPDGTDPIVASAIGDAVGRLSLALRDLRPEASPAYWPCYELERTHPSCPGSVIASFCETPPAQFAGKREELGRIGEALRAFEAALPAIRALPHQLVHGDVNDSNLLADPQDLTRIAAILDFEFCTMELRAMEPAVVLAGWMGEEDHFLAAEAFLRSYANIVSLSAEEIEALPLLMKLRRLDVFVHFLGRYLSGVDDAAVLLQQTRETDAGLTALSRQASRIRNLLRDTLMGRGRA
ncbi:phosphotransferase [Cohnella sp. JJ-181]|uniref:phosphotransferase n=1 Tax=Cohnella rhizoplanae TaxID=2974897 RepID=UPI0022FF79A8|nr:phosphotransferase [Cohnella sp. JJ-181]CAI6085047.1 Homoserine kinase [Cohnella sp. JJ-181]